MFNAKDPRDLLPLRRMAARLGVPSKWLKEQAELGKVPGLKAGARWLFVPDIASAAVAAMASGNATKVAALKSELRDLGLNVTTADELASKENEVAND